ncbi:hypothetical protein [Salisediminibacterium halotolerans]|uniref:Uncharacterized protein n=1 Tax=Salisediminibacterium halotolerans TaxID=517425 RepID=A0A1H9TM44_9BACI|nr:MULTISPECIES: hypothetical protein [Salisediminibacterium]RLJ72329.1 hypothetical protein BCL39_2229 [Actinophytocola xinjiangensis]RPE85543.1 hypothetical protein EDD67_2364 [Salisediminibacterium halotolerans]TWG33498.1 hypothetical protein BCL52_2224 [Salisediminibacterium halotolerans]SER98265.1 hypothetical protein SAMN05444126_11082 [Salisediminibacterium haloalkalitolerans]GEL08945.1 hypothetical protein SHA02_23610 [Salisediminibacterium halotolerans]
MAAQNIENNAPKETKREYILIFSLLAIAVIVGIFVGLNEEWVTQRNFSAGYMAGSLLTALLLFAVYRSAAFIVTKLKKAKH